MAMQIQLVSSSATASQQQRTLETPKLTVTRTFMISSSQQMEKKNTTILYACVSFIFVIIALKKLFQFKGRKRGYKNLPPSPPCMPVIGHLHLIKPPTHRFLYNLSKQYGPIVSLRFGSRFVVVVSSFEAAQECFTKNDIVFANRPKSLSGKHISYNYTTLLQAPYGDRWRNLRRITAIEVLSSNRVNVFSPIRRDEIKRLLKKLSANYSRQEFSKVELKTLFSELTINVMMRIVAGKRYFGDDVLEDEEEAGSFKEIVGEAFALSGTSNPGDHLPTLNWISNYEKRIVKISKRMDEFFQRLVDERRNKKEACLENTDSMIDHLLSLQHSEPHYYTDQTIKGLAMVSRFDDSISFSIPTHTYTHCGDLQN